MTANKKRRIQRLFFFVRTVARMKATGREFGLAMRVGSVTRRIPGFPLRFIRATEIMMSNDKRRSQSGVYHYKHQIT
ncbi:hypothetical protein [Silvimonas sp.]|uniref:hypothetical protein n=1 Tax=Silvimonas sp. TaxID=2650811 RepID=UPI0028401CA8|nr:hypothetical protein [Silvimonas sp.]MDR3426286.1 hypothetical protein [Silvimonas sp.]